MRRPVTGTSEMPAPGAKHRDRNAALDVPSPTPVTTSPVLPGRQPVQGGWATPGPRRRQGMVCQGSQDFRGDRACPWPDWFGLAARFDAKAFSVSVRRRV